MHQEADNDACKSQKQEIDRVSTEDGDTQI